MGISKSKFMNVSKYCKDLFITAWEGGSSYWATVNSPYNAEKTFEMIVEDDFALKIYDIENPYESWILTKQNMVGSITKLRNEYPRHYANLINGTWDAETADVWFQLVVIGELTFG